MALVAAVGNRHRRHCSLQWALFVAAAGRQSFSSGHASHHRLPQASNGSRSFCCGAQINGSETLIPTSSACGAVRRGEGAVWRNCNTIFAHALVPSDEGPDGVSSQPYRAARTTAVAPSILATSGAETVATQPQMKVAIDAAAKFPAMTRYAASKQPRARCFPRVGCGIAKRRCGA
jgi:hypothetical protein